MNLPQTPRRMPALNWKRIMMSSKTLSWYLNGLIIKVIPAQMDCTKLDAKMVDKIR